MDSAQIVVIGSYNRDVILRVAHLPAPGETCLALGRLEAPGGKGSNQAIQAARCGAKVAMLAALGDDAAGGAAIEAWRGLGLETSAVARLAGLGTGMAMILVDDAGENSIVVDSGANAALDPTHAEAAADLIGAAKLVVAQLETPLDATLRAFELARAAGVATLLNAAPAPEALPDALLDLTDILVVNEGEAQTLAGDVAPEAAGPALLARVRTAVVVTLGARGAALFPQGAPASVAPAHKVEVVDTTGAGDAFIGAFAARLAATGDLSAALAWGSAAGALACTALGATSSFAGPAEIAALAGG